jgi:ribosome maturation factor RimP
LGVVSVQVLTHRIPMTVQVLVRRGDGSDVSLDDCAALSAPLGEALEASALLDAPYVLEVSSPGIGEELSSDRDFTSFRSFPVAVHRLGPDGVETIQEGLLIGRDAEVVQLNVRGRTVRLPRQEVVRVRLVSPRDGP